MKIVYGCRTGKITISAHGMKRLEQRIKSYGEYGSWEKLVKAARYLGVHYSSLPNKFQKEYQNKVWYNSNTNVIKYYNGFFFIFGGSKGRARTLITVFGDKDHK